MLTGALIGWLLVVNGVRIWLAILAGGFIGVSSVYQNQRIENAQD